MLSVCVVELHVSVSDMKIVLNKNVFMANLCPRKR